MTGGLAPFGGTPVRPTPIAGTPVRPTLAQEDVVTTHASPASAWGAHSARIIRAANGDVYTTYIIDGADNQHFDWVLARRAVGSSDWRTVITAATATEPGNPPALLLGPDGKTVLVAYLSPPDSASAGAPHLYDSSTGQSSTIPGTWLTGANLSRSGASYLSASIDNHGRILVWEDVACIYFTPLSGPAPTCVSANVPGTYYWSFRDDTGWHQQQWVSKYRQAYNFLLPVSSSELRVIGTRDLLQAETSYAGTNPCGGSPYCFDQAVMQTWAGWSNQPGMSPQIVRPALDAGGYNGQHQASVEDAYVDTAGRTHAIMSVQDAGSAGTFTNHHIVIGADGRVKDVLLPSRLQFSNLARITQDTTGRFWIYSVGPGQPPDVHRCTAYIAGGAAGDTDGTRLGPVTDLRFTTPSDCEFAVRNFDVNPRTGTALADYIDGVVAADNGRTWMHYRIGLRR